MQVHDAGTKVVVTTTLSHFAVNVHVHVYVQYSCFCSDLSDVVVEEVKY